MAYATPTEVKVVLANALTSGNPSQTGVVDMVDIGNSLTSTIPLSTFYQFIRFADQEIDAAISSVYRVPLRRVHLESFNLAIDITAGDGTTALTPLVLEDTSRLLNEDIILIRDGVVYQEVTVASIINSNKITITVPMTDSYLASTTTVQKIGFPFPIPLISARLAAAQIYDKYFANQADGNKSEYGIKLRADAMDDLNGILSGTIKVMLADANDYIGRRFYNPAISDVMSSAAEPKDFFKKGS